jgi:mannose-6-phosphate isomerase-like protein (cupin superfamily)
MLNNDIPKNTKVIKPWGSEYTIFKNSISSTKLLRINKNKGTSLHCHPIKKTGFILIKGSVEVDLGFYNKKKLKSISRLMIRPGLFHSTKNHDDETAMILEIETPIDKDDLVRFKDDYGRENKPYEDENFMEKLSEEEPVFEEPQMNQVNNYKIDNVLVKLEKTNDIEKLKNNDLSTIFAIVDGGLKSENNLLVLSPGDIVGGDTIKKLTEAFKIDNYITYLSII